MFHFFSSASKRQARRRTSSRLLALGVTATLFGTSACATTPATATKKDAPLHDITERVEEVERTNSRLTVRMEELEDQLFLLNDRVESHRLALQRRAYRPRTGALASRREPQALQPAPESYYASEEGGATDVYQARSQRPVQRIQLSQPKAKTEQPKPEPAAPAPKVKEEDYEDVVISEDEYRAFFGEPKAPVARVVSSGSKKAQPSVTSERLGTSASSKVSPERPKKSTFSHASSAPKSTGLKLYKDSLSEYRAGNYHNALVGFQTFLKSKPKRDYVDNALYWIGECHYGLGDMTQAVTHFEKVLDEQPDGNKVPDAMLKMSLALDKQGSSARSKQVLESLVEQYPQTHAAGLGRKRLAP